MKGDAVRPYPKILYVKRVTDVQHEYFQVADDQASLVGIEPAEVATYQLVVTKKWKRIIVPDWAPGTRSRAAALTTVKRKRSRQSVREA